MKKTIFEEMGGIYQTWGLSYPCSYLTEGVSERISQTFKIKKNVEVTDNGKIII